MNGASVLLLRLLFLQCVYFWAGAAHANDVAARCGGGRWAVVLSDGYVVGTFGGVYETGYVPRSSEFSPMRDVLVNTASAGGVFLRYYGEIEVIKELGGSPSRYFFTRNGGGIRYFTSAPVEAIFPVESMKGDRCLEKTLVIDDLREEFPRKDGCGSLEKSISKLRSPEYQDAIDAIASIEYSHGELECLVDYIADTSVLYSTEFWVPYGRSYYHAPFDTVGALVEMLISGKLDVRTLESPRTESEHELHRLAWRDFLEYRKRVGSTMTE